MTAQPAGHLDDLLAQAASTWPEREALVWRDTRWTYRGLERGARRVAASFESAVGAGARVGIVGANHPAYVLGYFAAHALGASTVEVSPDESVAAVRHALERARPAVLLTDRDDLDDAAASAGVAVVRFAEVMGRADDGSAPYSTGSHRPLANPDDEASVVFTSGTTGSPKGVVLTHRNILFVVGAVREYLSITAQDRYGVALPISHTYGKSNVLSAIAAGATTVFLENFQDYPGFFEQLARGACTLLSVVPFHLNILARRGLPPGPRPPLRALTTSGGPLSAPTQLAVTRCLPEVRLYCMYGLTESSTRCTYLDPALASRKIGSVGRPLNGTEIEIRGHDGSPLPPGGVGEIAVRGPNVMRGYLGEPELTAATMVGGWLLTGDLGRLDDDGFLFIVGRKKEIIKVAGERVDPTEIEAVLSTHPDVLDVAVVGTPDPVLGEMVVACVVPRPGAGQVQGLTRYCAAHLAAHKIPRRVTVVDHIPRSGTGKVRRFLLAGV